MISSNITETCIQIPSVIANFGKTQEYFKKDPKNTRSNLLTTKLNEYDFLIYILL